MQQDFNQWYWHSAMIVSAKTWFYHSIWSLAKVCIYWTANAQLGYSSVEYWHMSEPGWAGDISSELYNTVYFLCYWHWVCFFCFDSFCLAGASPLCYSTHLKQFTLWWPVISKRRFQHNCGLHTVKQWGWVWGFMRGILALKKLKEGEPLWIQGQPKLLIENGLKPTLCVCVCVSVLELAL